MKAYNTSKDTAEVIGHRNIHNPVVIDYMNGLLDNLGLTDEYIGLKIKTILDKSVTKQSLKHTQPSDGIRIAEMLYRLKDKFPAERKQITKQELRVSLSGKTTEELKSKLDSVMLEAKRYRVLLSK
jgi:hypothetical protein